MICLGDNIQIKNEKSIWETLFCCFGKRRNRPNSDFSSNSNICKANTKSERSFTPPLTNPEPIQSYLLPAIRHHDIDKKCMVIDLDETLVHSSFKVCTFYIKSVSSRLRSLSK